MRMEPERYYEENLQSTDFVLENRDYKGGDVQQSIFADSQGGLNQRKSNKPVDVVVTVKCTLEEFYNGAIKQVDFTRQVVIHDAKSLKTDRQTQQVEVKPGFSESTELVFKKMGNQAPGHIHANLVIKFKQVEHGDYRRKGHDLILKHKVTLQQAFENAPCAFRTLDGRNLTIACDEQICPQTCKLVENEGMPMEGTEQKGNLYLTFDIEFPTQFQLATKQTIISALQASEAQIAGI